MKIVGVRPFAASLLVAALAIAVNQPVLAGNGNGSPAGGGGVSGGSTGNGNGNGNVSAAACNPTDVGPSALDCIGYEQGSYNQNAFDDLITQGVWSGLQGATLVQFHNFAEVDDQDGDASTGLLELLADLNGPFVLALRGGNDWAGYYYGEGMAAGSLISFDIRVADADVHHSRVAIYTAGPAAARNPELAPGVIPEPSGLAALIPGLLAIGIGARRRRRS